MADIEKVVKGLECCSGNIGTDCNECPYNANGNLDVCGTLLADDALELLKEQQDRLEQMTLDNTDLRNCYEELKDRPEIVRCKDCKHYTLEPGKWECDLYDWVHEPDWFCKDGERKGAKRND